MLLSGLITLTLLAALPYGLLLLFTESGRQFTAQKTWKGWHYAVAFIVSLIILQLMHNHYPPQQAREALKWADTITHKWESGDKRGAIQELDTASGLRPWERNLDADD